MGWWVPSAISVVIREARPCSAECTALTSRGRGQVRVPSGTTMQTLLPSTSVAASCSATKSETWAALRTPCASPIRVARLAAMAGVSSRVVVMEPLSSPVRWGGNAQGQLVATLGRVRNMVRTIVDMTPLHPDRLLPAELGPRAIARRLYAATAGLPIISPHGHVPPQWLADDTPFADPTSLLVSPDHYVFRLLHAQGVSLADLGVGGRRLDADGSRRAWGLLFENWHAFRGTSSKFWLESVLSDVFHVDQYPCAATADDIYDHVADALTRPEFRPRALA